MDSSDLIDDRANVGVGRSAVGHIPSHLRLWLATFLLLGLDLWSKQWAFQTLEPDRARPFISGLIEFRRSLNDGAVFGSFSGYTSVFIIASILALVFVLYLFAGSTRKHRSLHVALGLILAGALGNLYDRAFIEADIVEMRSVTGGQTTWIGRIMSESSEESIQLGTWPEGALLRTFDADRVTVRRQGVVRDFIRFVPDLPEWIPGVGGRPAWPWVFNVADASLVMGVAVLLLSSLFERSSARAPSLVTT